MFVPNGCPNSLHKTLSADPFLIPSYQILSSWEVMLFNLYFSQSLYSSRWLQLLVLPFLPSCWILSLLWCLAAWSCFSILPTCLLLPENLLCLPHMSEWEFCLCIWATTLPGADVYLLEMGRNTLTVSGLRILTLCHHCSLYFCLISEGVWTVIEGTPWYVGAVRTTSLLPACGSGIGFHDFKQINSCLLWEGANARQRCKNLAICGVIR